MAEAPKVKAASSLSNGISIGLGGAMLALGLLMAFSLNAIYNEQTAYLAANSIQVNTYSYGFSDQIFLISTGALVSMLGAYLLIVGLLGNYSEKARVAFSQANWGNRLINGGVIGVSLSSANLVRDLYRYNWPDWYLLVVISLIAICLIIIITGVLLLRRTYSRSLKPTKV